MTEVFEIHREAQLIQKVMDAYEEACINDTTPMQNVLSSFVNAKDRLFIKLINEEKNRKMLQDIPHRMVQDLAIVYALHLKDALDFSGTVTVTNTLLQMWGIDEETLYTQAMLNTPRVSPAILCPLREMMESFLPTAQFLNAPPMDISEYDFRTCHLRNAKCRRQGESHRTSPHDRCRYPPAFHEKLSTLREAQNQPVGACTDNRTKQRYS